MNKTPIPEQRKTNEKIELAIYLEGEQTNRIPSKESGYYYDREKSTCTNDAYINWDSVSWSPVVNNMSEYKTRCEIHFTRTYTEGILNGTDPVLKDELVPVTIEENGTVKKADLESEWYSYANKEWANSIILDDQYDTLNSQGNVYGATKNDGYVTLDGVDDYIDLGLENYEFTEGITLMTVFSMKNLPDDTGVIFGNLDNAGGSIYIKSTGEIRAQLYINGAYKYLFSQRYMNINDTHIVVITYDNVAMKMFIDGTLVVENNVSGPIAVSPEPFFIGANPQSNGNHIDYANVDIYQVQLYDRALNEGEISLASEGKVANNEGLLRYVDFTDKSYEDNEIIPEEAIESYFVWIPRYRYQIFDDGDYPTRTGIINAEQQIEIIFENKDTVVSDGLTVGNWLTHPAFTAFNSNGMWVGKFETGYDGAMNTIEAEQNVNDSSKIIVKPNIYSWRGIQIANAFYSSYDYQRNLDSHMMKNTEWGAVAYLGHSVYGSATSVRLNNNSDYITGYQANNEPTCGYTATNEECNRYCNDGSCNLAYPNSVLSSTTGNISGIYDMSGGAWDYVMGVMMNEEGIPFSGRNSLDNSGFNGPFSCINCAGDMSGLTELTTGYEWPASKYYDIYSYSQTAQALKRRILGDATGEMGPFETVNSQSQIRNISSWYKNRGEFVWKDNPWFVRGAHYTSGTEAGIFAFGYKYNEAFRWNTFRLVLTPQ